MRRRPRHDLDPDRRPEHLRGYRAEDWTNAPPPTRDGFMAGCPVCAHWHAQADWTEAHPDAPLDLDHDMPQDPWHPELIFEINPQGEAS